MVLFIGIISAQKHTRGPLSLLLYTSDFLCKCCHLQMEYVVKQQKEESNHLFVTMDRTKEITVGLQKTRPKTNIFLRVETTRLHHDSRLK